MTLNIRTPKQTQFAHAYYIPTSPTFLNMTQSAIAAGYSENNAGSIGYQVAHLPQVEEYGRELYKTAGISKESVLHDMSTAYRFDNTLLFEAVEITRDEKTGKLRYAVDRTKLPVELLILIDTEIDMSTGGKMRTPKKMDLIGKIIGVLGLLAPVKQEVTVNGTASVSLPSNERMK